jgi:hypothetical protein
MGLILELPCQEYLWLSLASNLSNCNLDSKFFFNYHHTSIGCHKIQQHMQALGYPNDLGSEESEPAPRSEQIAHYRVHKFNPVVSLVTKVANEFK